MKAVVFEKFKAPLELVEVADPIAEDDGVVIRVEASGICRSDWHGWMGHDAEITRLPHVPGHELAGVIEDTGQDVTRFKAGERVTVPFVCGCGECPECLSGNQQVCDNQYQPGFSGWGSFAEYVSIRFADTNLVRLPDDVEFVTAASLGCRFGTSFRAVVEQGRVRRGDWVAVHGCGGVGLSAVMIAHALGAHIVAVDVEEGALERARSLGATATINAAENDDVAGLIHRMTDRGAHVSLDAFGSAETCANSILCLRKRGRHVQVGLLAGDDYLPRLPMDQVIARELELYGSHGIVAARYDPMLRMIAAGDLNPGAIIGKTIPLEEAPGELAAMNDGGRVGITVIDRF
ncbi:MAG: zinc-dependent alcohol dehydrogenase family protein [Candidatus Krumholzibacteriota bacterium]|nr:zinc-dependent alcohol dehydrogenase family protein [Candidatus Krumholzibacteriota bacterium]